MRLQLVIYAPESPCVWGEQVEGGLGTHSSAGANMIRVYLQPDTEGKLLGEVNGPLELATQGWRLQGPGYPRLSVLPSILLLSEPGPLMCVCPPRLSSMLVLPSLSL